MAQKEKTINILSLTIAKYYATIKNNPPPPPSSSFPNPLRYFYNDIQRKKPKA